MKSYICEKCRKKVDVFDDAIIYRELCGDCSKDKKFDPSTPESGISFCPNCHTPITPKNMWVLIGGDGKGTLACRNCADTIDKVEQIQCRNCGKITYRFLKNPQTDEKPNYLCYVCHTKFFGRWNKERINVKRLIRIEDDNESRKGNI